MKRRQLASILLALALGVGSTILTGCSGKSTYYTHNVDGVNRNNKYDRNYSTKYQKVGEIPDDGGFEPLAEPNDVIAVVKIELPNGWDYNKIYAVSQTDTEALEQGKKDLEGKRSEFDSAVEEVNTLISKKRAENADVPIEDAEKKVKDLQKRFNDLLNAQPTSRSSFKLLRADEKKSNKISLAAEIPTYDLKENIILYPVVSLQYSGTPTNTVNISDKSKATTILTFDNNTLSSDASGFPEEATLTGEYAKIIKELNQAKDSLNGIVQEESKSEESTESKEESEEETSESEEESSEASVEESSEPEEESSEIAEESSEASVEESSEAPVEESSEPVEELDADTLAIVKLKIVENETDEKKIIKETVVAIVFGDESRNRRVQMKIDDDGVLTAKLPKATVAGEEITNPQLRFEYLIQGRTTKTESDQFDIENGKVFTAENGKVKE